MVSSDSAGVDDLCWSSMCAPEVLLQGEAQLQASSRAAGAALDLLAQHASLLAAPLAASGSWNEPLLTMMAELYALRAIMKACTCPNLSDRVM